MPLAGKDISKIRNKVVRGEMNQKRKKEQKQAKLKKRIARKEAEARGETVERGITRTIENTREWLGDEDGEYADPRTRPAPVTVNEQTGDVTVDMGTLSNLFPIAPPPPPQAEGSSSSSTTTPATEPKVLITTSPGKPPHPFTKTFLDDLQALLGGKKRADVVPRRSPKFEMGRVARWARGRGYGCIMVVGEDHAKPSSLTVSLLPYGPTAHFRLTGITLCKDIPGHASPTSHPPELVLNHFQTPLGLSLATLLSQMFLPPSQADLLSRQGFIGRQVVLAQNSRDFVFIRRYRYMFALKSHRLGKTTKGRSDVERMTEVNPDEEIDDTVKTRFQEIGPQFTIKMRWIRRGPLGETGDEREKREKQEAESGEAAQEFGEEPTGGEGDEEVDLDEMNVDGQDGDEEEDDAEAEEAAKREIGLDESDSRGQPNFQPTASTSTAPTPTATEEQQAEGESSQPNPKKRKRRTKPSHPLYRPSPSPSVTPEPEPVPLPSVGKKKNPELTSALSTVGKTWHAGRGEGGVREAAKRREWNWDAKMQVSRRKFFL
ncbi:rRNA-binding ribosome biosynthesis protein RPF1 [Sporobolomyces salmoneus]|uniref:rRNA-binding ribosome biosynthesis protein RPF1 n=1 Tax=Sporobolomyces salmoneus TaxID=183962 RepID=UPI0031755847